MNEQEPLIKPNKYVILPVKIGNYQEGKIACITAYTFKCLKKAYPQTKEVAKSENYLPLSLEQLTIYDQNIKKADEEYKQERKTLPELQKEVQTNLILKQRAEATEAIVNYFCRKNSVYAVRSDDKKEIWIYENGIYVENGVSYISEFCRTVLGVAYTNHLKNQVVEKIEADNYIDSDTFFKFDKNLDFLPVLNGLLNLRTRELLPFSEDYIFFSKIPVEYNPEKECPKIQKFLRDICGDLQDVQTIQQFIGSCLYREQRWEKMLMCIGGGRNGKTKLAELNKTFLGAESVTGLQPSSFEDPENFAIHQLHGKLANMYMDISKKSLKNTSLLKSLSGRETVTVPRKFKTSLTFDCTCKFIFGANELPMSYDISDGFWGRWLLIDLPYTFVYADQLAQIPEKDRYKYKIRKDDIIKEITTKDELSGMLNWVLDGLEVLFQQNGFSYKYTTEEVKSLWVRKSDSFIAFFMDCCTDEFEAKIPKQELQKAYISYCRDHNIKISHPKRVNNALQDLGCYDGRFRSNADDFYYWENVGFKQLYLNHTDANGFQYYKKPSPKEKVINWINTHKDVRLQDIKIRFGEKIINKLLTEGVLIQSKADKVRLNK